MDPPRLLSRHGVGRRSRLRWLDHSCGDQEIADFVELNRGAVRWTGGLSTEVLRRSLRCGAYLLATGSPLHAGCHIIPSPVHASGAVGEWCTANLDEEHVLIERVVVAPEVRRRGLASALYAGVAGAFPERPLVAAVKTTPRNEASLRFHEAMGFSSIGSATPFPGTTVSFLHLERGTVLGRPIRSGNSPRREPTN